MTDLPKSTGRIDLTDLTPIPPERSSTLSRLGAPTPAKPEEPRVAVLFDAVKLTAGDRARTYGPPPFNMSCAAELKAVFDSYRAHSLRTLSLAEIEAIHMALTKISRITCGAEVHRDNYVDAAAYLSIAYESAMAGPQSGSLISRGAP